MQASMFGAPCVDPMNNPAPTGTAATNTVTAILNGDFDGCDQFGADPYMKQLLTASTLKDFQAANTATMTQAALGNLLAATTGT